MSRQNYPSEGEVWAIVGGIFVFGTLAFALQTYLGFKYDLWVKPEQHLKQPSAIEKVIEKEELPNLLQDYQPRGE